MKRIIFIFAVMSMLVGYAGIVVYAQTMNECHYKTSILDAEQDFAPTVNIFSDTQELLIFMVCDSAKQLAKINIAQNANTPIAVWEKAFILIDSSNNGDGSEKKWQEISLTGKKNNNKSEWIMGHAEGVVSADLVPIETEYIAVYICSWLDTEWKCGCTDTSCTRNNYSIQSFALNHKTNSDRKSLTFDMDPDGKNGRLPPRSGRVSSKLLYRGSPDQKRMNGTYDIGEPFTLTRTFSKSSFTGIVASLEWRSGAESCALTARSSFKKEYTWLSESNLVNDPPADFVSVPYRPFEDTTFVFSDLPASGRAAVLLPLREIYTTSETERKLVAVSAVPTVFTVRCGPETATLTAVSDQISMTLDSAGVILVPTKEQLIGRGYMITERLGGSGVPRVDIKTALSGGSVTSTSAPCTGCTSYIRTAQVFTDTVGTIICKESFSTSCAFFTVYMALNADTCRLDTKEDLGTYVWTEEYVVTGTLSRDKKDKATITCRDESGLSATDTIQAEER